MDEKREAMLNKLAARNNRRILLQSQNLHSTPKASIDLSATEKVFLQSSPSTLDMKTPVSKKFASFESSSPILSFDEKADKQITALATWCNTMLGLVDSEEMDLGSSKKEACERIKNMLSSKNTTIDKEEKTKSNQYAKIFERNDSEKVRKQVREYLLETGMSDSINNLLAKSMMSVKPELSVYGDLALQTSLLHIFLSFHPALLKVSLEAIFNTKIETTPKTLMSVLSRFMLKYVFTDQKMLKNKKFAQGSGKLIITPAGKEALHRHFLATIMKIMYLIEVTLTRQIIKNVSRMFSKSSSFKCLDDVWCELSKDLLAGKSVQFKKAFAQIGFTSSYKQSFIDNYDYKAVNFESFSNGIILAKLVETVADMKPCTILSKLRDPCGDRVRKLKNVEIVLAEMKAAEINVEGITKDQIVGCKKEPILALLWSIIGVRVASEKKIKPLRFNDENERMTERKQRRRSEVHDDLSSEMLRLCKKYGREYDVEVTDLDGLVDGKLLEKVWTVFVPNGLGLEHYEGETKWQKIISLAESEMKIARGIDQHIALFVKMFFEKVNFIRNYTEQAVILQRAWRNRQKKLPKMYDIVMQVIQLSCNTRVISSSSPPRLSSSFCDATFTVARASTSSSNELASLFRIPKTPRLTTTTISRETFIIERIEEEVGEKEQEKELLEEKDGEEQKTVEEEVELTTIEETFDGTLTTNKDESIGEVKTDEEMENQLDNEVKEDKEEQKKVEEEEEERNEVEVIVDESTIVEPMEIDENEGVDENEKMSNEDIHELGSSVQLVSDSIADDFITNCSITDNIEVDESQSKECEEATTDCKLSEEEALIELKQVADEAQRLVNQMNVKKEKTEAELEYERLKEVKRKNDEILRRAAENQKEYVEKYMKDDLEGISNDELMEILRGKKKIAKEQRRLKDKLTKIEAAYQHRMTTDEAFVNEPSENDRNIAGQEDVSIRVDQPVFAAINDEGNVEEKEEKMMNDAAVKIQKMVRGFLARRRWMNKMTNIRVVAEEFRKKVEQEEADYSREVVKNKDSSEKENLSAAKKLKNHTIFGLDHPSLSIVNLSAMIIDRLLGLLPELIEPFVVEYEGIQRVLKILNVADQGMSYRSIVKHLFSILQKVFTYKKLQTYIMKVSKHLTPLAKRLFGMMLSHSKNDKVNFMNITDTLIAIGMSRSKKADCEMDGKYWLTRIKPFVEKDVECLNQLQILANIMDLRT